ncbi:hypothetical protein [Acidianus manzaensis]|uniref:Uncharacterized protein n=1 Tax=Acidianus manzaensis TaxID=282676 RepID=A0A1W6K375_9CREN|nr:hypothetical protein [Acidianus manzaensis]ARM76935.1 hypothetical protein B6F84_13520 [Acidianus manzaensis]
MKEPYVKTLYEFVNYYYSLEKISLNIFLSDEKVYLSDLINVMKFNPNPKFIVAFLIDFSPKKVKNVVIKKLYRSSLV